MPQVSFEFLQIASLSRRRHGFDSGTGRQHLDQANKVIYWGLGSGDSFRVATKVQRNHRRD
jgi:hypothetical protein